MKTILDKGRRFVVVAAIVAVIASFMVFYAFNVKRISRQNENYLADITYQKATLMADLFDENTRYIESVALVLGTEFENQGLDPKRLNVERQEQIDADSLQIVSDTLKYYENRFAFSYLRFIDLYGRDYTTNQQVIQAVVRERPYFIDGVSGHIGMTYILDSKVTSERQIGFYSPVTMDEEIMGIVVGFYGEGFMSDMLATNLFDYDCEVLLCGSDGTVVYNTFGNDNYDDFIEIVESDLSVSEVERERIRAAFAEGRNVTYYYVKDGARSVVCTAYVDDISDLFIVISFPPRVFSEMTRGANLNGVRLLVALVVIFVALSVYYVSYFLIQRKRIETEAKNSNDIHAAMSRLFENFIIVDVPSRRYDYIEGMPEVGEIPKEGDYDAFVASLLQRFTDAGEREEAARLLAFDRIVAELNQGRDILSYNLHAPIREEEWFTYNFIVVARGADGVREFVIARQDITVLQRQEDQIRKTLEQARDEAEKGNRAKSDFLANMSHDIRTPMNAIIGYTNIARDRLDDRGVVEDSLSKIAASGEYLLSLINDILDMSRIESGKLQLSCKDGDLLSIFDRVRDITRTQIQKKRQRLHCDMTGIRHSRARLDELRFQQVVINILSNAIKYTPEGGDLYVTGVEEFYQAGRAGYRFAIRDTGIGMSEDFLPHIFESFAREKNSRIDKIQGTGLGMAITARLVNLMDGTITVESQLGVGSEFTVRVAFELWSDSTDRDGVKAPRQKEKAVADGLKGRRILLVEDNDINAEIATMVLSQYGLEVERAENGREGVDMALAAGEGRYDAVLMDIQMPVMNGYEATQAIRGSGRAWLERLPIIAMSANAYDEDVKDALDSGMNTHIAKPFDPDDLRGKLEKYILDGDGADAPK